MSKDKRNIERHQIRTAILVDGGFYRKRARLLFGDKNPKERAEELRDYCYKHLNDSYENRYLYRVFYYDCAPIDKNIYHPLTQKSVNLGKTDEYKWMNEFLKELKHNRKFALRLGKISEGFATYQLKVDITKKLFKDSIKLSDISENDFSISLQQKGVDMKIGIDISSLAYKQQVNQIILISGDSDFVPAAKQARREGIDFILDPMKATIKDDLFEHIDGIRTPSYKNKK